METESPVNLANLLGNQNDTVAWIISQPEDVQAIHASKGVDLLLGEAGQPKSASGHACIRLCGFVEQCSKAQAPQLREWAFSRAMTEKLFTFYVEWNETDQHRSMKLVLDLIVQLQRRNPDRETAAETEKDLLKTLVSIVIGTSTKPVAKSAIKTIDHLLSKGVFNLEDLRRTYVECRPQADSSDENEVWRSLFAEILQWMRVHFVCPTAGRFIVLLYRGLRARDEKLPIKVWHQWLLDYLADDPNHLEGIKNYIFVPLFRSNRPEALNFLREVANHDAILTTSQSLEMDISTLLQLAALETGKRVGLVEEPALSTEIKATDESSPLILHEKILTSVLSHPAHEVRSLAFSLLITSQSTTRPYSPIAFDLLRKHLGAYFADPDAKFRVDVMSRARDMFKRVRGSICVLKRSIPRARAKALKQKGLSEPKAGDAANSQPLVYHNNLISLPEQQLVQCLDYHVDFLRWYVRFLCGELVPTASYQRHVGSLKALSFILRMEGETSKTWETAEDQELLFDLFDGTWVRALFDLLMDPFDDVREMSSQCLKSILSTQHYRRFTLNGPGTGSSSLDELQGLLKRSNELARRTARADHSDGAARVGQLVYKFSNGQDKRLGILTRLMDELEGKLSIAEKDLARAVLDAPVHGDFAALRYIWQVVSEIRFGDQELETIEKLQDRLVDFCERIWVAVRSILCDDSPEGHLPQELEEVDGLNTKDVLSYSFRSVHESSNLMRSLALTIRNRSKPGHISPSASSFARMGNLTFEQLSTLRHRGAFTTVSSTFATCCQQTKHLGPADTANGESLLDAWYKGTMDAIYAQVSTTRRSAGIPSLMTGLLSANASSPAFEDVMEKLIEIAGKEAWVRETDGSNLPQVHAFNCLKDIFKNSLLTSTGNKSEKYLPECLELAANGLKSEVWAIRNCALILLRSLADTLFGSHESKSMIGAGWDGKANRIPYHKYPTLPSMLVNLLRSGHEMMSPTAATATGTVGAESVFPSLDIVRRAGPPDVLREELQAHIAKYLASPVWHMREMAARTLCSCLLHDKWLQVIRSLVKEASQDQARNTLNYMHGILLALKCVFDRLSEVALDQLIADLPDLITMLKESNIDKRYAHCHDIMAAYLEVVNQISEFGVLHSMPLEQIQVPLPSSCRSALMKIQVTRYRVHAAYRSPSPLEGLREIFIGGNLGDDTMTASLALIPKLWSISSTADDQLSVLCGFYVGICLETTDKSEPQAAALEELATILDHLLRRKSYDALKPLRLSTLWAALPFRPVNPSLSNAILRFSGCVVATLLHFGQISPAGLQGWGKMMADAGLEDKSFDTRFAAAESLRSFFAVVVDTCTSEDYVPALLALYDALNDDDDEVRDVGSASVQSIIGQPLVSIEAATRLLDWLATTFGSSASFKSTITSRLAGARNTLTTPLPADEQLSNALRVDDSLFVVEEQNLFVDEVREAKRWISVYEAVEWDVSEASLRDLDGWLCGGLTRLQSLLNQDDGPLGWASDPQVFAICSLLILCSVAMVSGGHASQQLRETLGRTKEALNTNKGKHISGLLTEPLQKLQIN